MTVTEKAAYLKGMASMLKLDPEKDEAKVLTALLDVIDDLALTVSDLEDELSLVTEQLDAVDEDLDSLEEYIYDDDCDCCGDEDMYEVDCPACGETVYFDSSVIEDGAAECPNCGEKLDFDLDCDCGCDGCDSND